MDGFTGDGDAYGEGGQEEMSKVGRVRGGEVLGSCT